MASWRLGGSIFKEFYGEIVLTTMDKLGMITHISVECLGIDINSPLAFWRQAV